MAIDQTLLKIKFWLKKALQITIVTQWKVIFSKSDDGGGDVYWEGDG